MPIEIPKEGYVPKSISLNEYLRFFIIKGSNNLPSQIHLGVYRDGVKIRGHNLLPEQLTDKTFCFEDLKTMEQYKCPCGKESCLYGAYLRVCINNYRKQMGVLK